MPVSFASSKNLREELSVNIFGVVIISPSDRLVPLFSMKMLQGVPLKSVPFNI